MYENDEEDEILLGWSLLNDAAICFRRGVNLKIKNCPTEGLYHFDHILDLANTLRRIEKICRRSLEYYESQIKRGL